MIKETWKTHWGFIFAAIGGAVGIGNIWRFPYLLGENGAGFLFVYIIALFLIGVPLMIMELSFGRRTGKSPITAFETLRGKSKKLGYVIIINSMAVLSFYIIVVAWVLRYFTIYLFGGVSDPSSAFSNFTATPSVLIFQVAVLVFAGVIVYHGVRKGIERSAKILIPMLVVLMLILVARSLTLPGAFAGLATFLDPSNAVINGHIILVALGQIFFSLGLSLGILMTYGSYLNRKENIARDSVIVSLGDFSISLLACLIIFPIVFAFGIAPAEGPGLAFISLPHVFSQMAYGTYFALAFFLLLFFAGITSVISGVETFVASIGEKWNMTRGKMVGIVSVILFAIGVPSALSMEAFEMFNHFAGTVMLPLIGFFTCMSLSYVYGAEKLSKEAGIKMRKAFEVVIKYIAPVALLIVLVWSFI
ncbi:MAG: sodium-dependent transporter [archaeon]